MKRFFSRFSTGGSAPPQPPPFDQTWEKPDLPGVASNKVNTSPKKSGQKVKALAARYEAQAQPTELASIKAVKGGSPGAETLLRTGSTHLDAATTTLTPTQPSSNLVSATRSEAPSAAAADVSQRKPLPPGSGRPRPLNTPSPQTLPRRMPGSSLPENVDLHRRSVDGDFLDRKHGKDQRQPSAGSQGSASASKTVAFAPSPEKPNNVPAHLVLRPSSPAALSARGGQADNSLRGAVHSVDNPFTSNFAKPTAASQARARSSGRLSGSDSTGWGSQWGQTMAAIDRSGASAARAPKMGRANSLQSSSRRNTCGPHSGQESPSLTISSPTLMANHATGSTTSLSPVHGAVRPSTEANSIPFASTTHAQFIIRSSSPVSLGMHTSAAMQITGSGQGSARPDSSRRGSLTPGSIGSWKDGSSFPFGSVGSKTLGVPSWSEMTQEELVRNLGPRERTRQEVLWEIVASEERYVTELEKVKELYIDALLYPDQFDPDRLLSQPQSPATDDTGHGSHLSETAEFGAVNQTKRYSGVGAEGPPSSAELPIAARFMSATSAAQGGEGSSSGHGAPHQRLDLAAQAQADAQRSAGTRSPYSAGLLATPPSGCSAQSAQMENRRASIGSQRPGSGGFGANSRSNLAHGLGIGLGSTPLKDRNNARVPAKARSTARPGALSKAQKLRLKSKAAGQGDPMILTVPLPRSLRAVLEAISEGLVEAHALLSEALKARYEGQWPLVRGLADVFMKHSYILKHYALYVCHLQRALEELEEAALMERAMRGKKLKQERLSHTVGLGRTVCALEAAALEQGHGGLSIYISMSFQRLLKYPLLFQNLLFHTDPSTHEFESTVAMVVEVERLVRSIEDEKVNAEERDKTRDAFARIEGLMDGQVLRPRPDRVLIEEKALYDEHPRRSVSESTPKENANLTDTSDHEGAGSEAESSHAASQRTSGSKWNSSPGLRAALRNKRSYRRLSDFLTSEDKGSSPSKAPNMGSKKDLWLIRFSDVEIRCQRVGVTALPMVSSAALTSPGSSGAADEDAEMDFARRSKESKERLKALRNTTLRAKTRNLYRFVSVVAWRNAAARQAGQMQDADGGVEGLPTSHEVDEEDEDESSDDEGPDSSDSDSSSSDNEGEVAGADKYIRQSKLSFSYWGDKVEPRIGPSTPIVNASSVAAYRSLSQGANQPGGVNRSSGKSSEPRSMRQTRPSPRSSSPIKRPQGISSRLNEPMSASSITSAPEPVQTAVAQMHARQRNEKFGARLRGGVHSVGAGSSTDQVAVTNHSTSALASSMALPPKRQLSRS